jgi:hypothetical protein
MTKKRGGGTTAKTKKTKMQMGGMTAPAGTTITPAFARPEMAKAGASVPPSQKSSTGMKRGGTTAKKTTMKRGGMAKTKMMRGGTTKKK